MCGIAGVFYADPKRETEPASLAAMSEAIVHRGPDGDGLFRAPGVGLIHRRLSIIDLAGGSQPLGNEDGSIQVVFNGEIYNYRELKRELEGKGHRFATSSDTEVLVHLYEECGERLVERLRGMFAFALWDGPRRRLLLARDRLGIKPLYFRRENSRLLFASELKAILAAGDVPRDLDVAALEDYLTLGVVSGTRTIFRGIEKLAPGHTLSIDAERWNAQPRCYWRLEFAPDHSRSVEDWQAAVRAKLDETVQRHLIADVPVGAFLSGGIDSSVITALAAGKTREPIQTFSIGFREDAFNELPDARQTAAKYGTRHTEEVVTADAAELLDELCWFYDEPFADSSAIPTMLVSRLAAQHVKVVLSGDGGDEAFGGYARYPHDLAEAAIRRRLPTWLRHMFLAPLGRVWPKADWMPRWLRAKTTLTNLAADESAAYANTLSICRPPLRRQLLSADVAHSLNGHQCDQLVRDAYTHQPGDTLSRMIAADVATLLPDDFLVKVDRASMAYGLEVRPPLLDHELLELAATIPSQYKIRGGQTKWILKQSCRDLLPADLLARKKRGFEIPIDRWLRDELGPMFQDLVLAARGPAAELLDRRRVAALYEDHRRGRGRHGAVLWSLLVLSKWAETFLSPSSLAAPAARTADLPARRPALEVAT
jgi:asparagine synthase (glutamine-hydrolysing)